MAEILATAKDDVYFQPAVHVALALWGAGNVALGTASGILNHRDGANYLAGPIIAGVTGLPLIVMSIYNLVADSPPQAQPAGIVSCTVGRCRAGIPRPLVMSDRDGAPAPGLQLIEASF